jgi:hypothetical protein
MKQVDEKANVTLPAFPHRIIFTDYDLEQTLNRIQNPILNPTKKFHSDATGSKSAITVVAAFPKNYFTLFV